MEEAKVVCSDKKAERRLGTKCPSISCGENKTEKKNPVFWLGPPQLRMFDSRCERKEAALPTQKETN